MRNPVYCIIPNWNGIDSIGDAIASLEKQTVPLEVVVIENGSIDGSAEFIRNKFPAVTILQQPKNLGFAGGVNVGIRYALDQKAEFVALFNNDAVAKPEWLESLTDAARKHPEAGIITGKFVDIDNTHIDSTGDLYTTWGLPFPRGRGEKVSDAYDKQNWIFGATGGASLYRATMLEQVGLFDEDFFAYYEDIDISFRAQLAGWKVYYEPSAVACHQIGATSGKIKGFTTYQSAKNLPMIFWKNVPVKLMPMIFPRLFFAYWSFMSRALSRGQAWPATKGHVRALLLFPKKILERRKIYRSKVVSDQYIASILTPGLPPMAGALLNLQAKWARIRGRKP